MFLVILHVLIFAQRLPFPLQVKNEKAPITLFGQLLWREFFYVAATRNPNFDQMKGNDICIKIPWDENPRALAKWAEGMTGPWLVLLFGLPACQHPLVNVSTTGSVRPSVTNL